MWAVRFFYIINASQTRGLAYTILWRREEDVLRLRLESIGSGRGCGGGRGRKGPLPRTTSGECRISHPLSAQQKCPHKAGLCCLRCTKKLALAKCSEPMLQICNYSSPLILCGIMAALLSILVFNANFRSFRSLSAYKHIKVSLFF